MAKSCFLGRTEIQFRQSRWFSVLARKNFPEENYSTRHSGGRSHDLEAFSSSGKIKRQFVSGRQKAADYVKMLNDLSLAQERRRLCGDEWIFQPDNDAIHNTSITKNYLLKQKIILLDHTVCSPDLSPIENLWILIVAKVYGGGRQYSAISELKNAILDAWEKYLQFNFRNYLIVFLAEFLRLSKLMAHLQNIK